MQVALHHLTFLMVVERLHCHIDIENTRSGYQRLCTSSEMGLQPVHPRYLADHLEEPSYRIFGHHALNLEQFRHHSIEANGVHAGRPTALA